VGLLIYLKNYTSVRNHIGSVKNNSASCALRDGILVEVILECVGDFPERECDCCSNCSDGQPSTTVIKIFFAILFDISNATQAYPNVINECLPQFDDDIYILIGAVSLQWCPKNSTVKNKIMAIVHAITHPLIIIEEGLDIPKLFATIHSLSFFLFIPQSETRNQNHMKMKKNIMVNIGTYYTWA